MDSVNLKEIPSESVTDEADLAPSSIDLNSIPSAHVQGQNVTNQRKQSKVNQSINQSMSGILF